LSQAARSEAERGIARSDRPPVLVSALTGEGIEALRCAIDARFGAKDEVLVLEEILPFNGCSVGTISRIIPALWQCVLWIFVNYCRHLATGNTE